MERPSADFRPDGPVTLQLRRKTFIGGAMRYPGDVVTVSPQVFAPPDDQKAMRKKNDNVVLVGEDGPSVGIVRRSALAPISPVGNNARRPQGIPSGAVDVGGRIIGAAEAGDVADTVEYTASNPLTDPAAADAISAEAAVNLENRDTLAAMQDERNAQLAEASPIDDLGDRSKAELYDLAKASNIPVDRSMAKPDLVLYLRTALANKDAGTVPSTTGEGVEDNKANTTEG